MKFVCLCILDRRDPSVIHLYSPFVQSLASKTIYVSDLTPILCVCWFFSHLWLTSSLPELSLTIPITNSLAFLFTVLGEWWAEGKTISRDTWIGMALVLGGIGLCVSSKHGGS